MLPKQDNEINLPNFQYWNPGKLLENLRSFTNSCFFFGGGKVTIAFAYSKNSLNNEIFKEFLLEN